jgi:2-aminoadipate transaminase
MAEYVARGLFDQHIAAVNRVYRRKRDVAAQAIQKYCDPWVTFRLPDGGFYLWLKMDDRVDWQKVRTEAERGGVMFRPGERFMTQDASAAGNQYIRLAFSHVQDDELERGIQVLGDAITCEAPRL